VDPERNSGQFEPGIAAILNEIRDLRVEMRDDRQRADAERQRADAERQRIDEAWRQERRRVDEERRVADAAWWEERRRVDDERRLADAAWREERRLADAAWREERRLADEALRAERQETSAAFQTLLAEFREDSARREAATQQAFAEVRDVGFSIVKTLNRHTRILESINRNLGARRNGPSQGRNGRDT
jgi:hypothetical protein